MDAQEMVSALALRSVEGLGDRTYKLLVDTFGSASAAFGASKSALKEALGGKSKVAESIIGGGAYLDSAEALLERHRVAGGWLISYGCEGYPELLSEVYDPPGVLFGYGELQADVPAVAVVGSRRASPHSLKLTYSISRELAEAGVVVVSGLAEGIDARAHAGALDGGGKTIAVFGAGIDVVYPRSNKALAEKIKSGGGALLSEHPPGQKPDARFFPRRNRIISGMSMAVVVIEAAKKSGSLITANFALDEGREVFAAPGVAGSAWASGTNDLLRHGARIVESAEDILTGLGLGGVKNSAEEGRDFSSTLTAEARNMFHALEDAPIDIDTLATRAGFSPSKSAALLMELVILGYAAEWPGKRFTRLS